jgi:hypothetical protein
MPRGWEIRNRFIEDRHPTELSGGVTTRKMTAAEWAKYGPKSEKIRRPVIHLSKPQTQEKEDPEPMRSRIDLPTIITMARKHTLSQEGREKISEELGVSRVDVTNFICRTNVKKALKAENLWIMIGHPSPKATKHTAPKKQPVQFEEKPVTLAETPAPAAEDSTPEDDTSLGHDEVAAARDQIMNTFAKRQNLFDEMAKATVEKSDINVVGAYIAKMRDRIHLLGTDTLDPVDTAYLREIFIAIGCAAMTGLVIINRE